MLKRDQIDVELRETKVKSKDPIAAVPAGEKKEGEEQKKDVEVKAKEEDFV